MSNKKEIGERIRLYRKSRNMSQARLAEIIGKSTGAIGMYECGKREHDLDTIEALADAFNISMRDLIPSDEDTAEMVNGGIPATVPVTTEARILSAGVDRMPEEDRKRLLQMVELMFDKYKDYFETRKEDD